MMAKDQASIFHDCPDCGSNDWREGPCGGLSINVMCRQCGGKFNDMGPFGIEKIDPRRRKGMLSDKEERIKNGEYWIWQGDNTDHLESLICLIVIEPDDLRKLLKAQEANTKQSMIDAGYVKLPSVKNLTNALSVGKLNWRNFDCAEDHAQAIHNWVKEESDE